MDTGATFSLLPHKSHHPPAQRPRLIGPNGQPIRCWGEERLRLQFSGRTFWWTFLKADVTFPILGVDFLRSNRLSVSVATNQLVDDANGDTFRLTEQPSGHTASVMLPANMREESGMPARPTAPCPGKGSRATYAAAVARSSPPPAAAEGDTAAAIRRGDFTFTRRPPPRAASTPPQQPPSPPQREGQSGTATPSSIKELLAQYQDVLNPSGVLKQTTEDVAHHLQTRGPPIASKFRRLDAEKLAAAKKEFLSLEQAGIVRRSNSPWASPLHMVRKQDGSWRPCGDYRRLNSVTVPDTYPIPSMLDFANRAAGCTHFSKIDLKKGYHQVPMNPADIPKTAITTPFGLFEFTRMTFGMRNAGNTFQRLIDRTMAGVDSASPYLDDILVFSRGEVEHRRDLQETLERLKAAGLTANAEKCEFNKPSIEFLGHTVSASGIAPLPDRVAAIAAHPRPTNIKELQNFLGVINFYRKFVPGAANILRPLTDALKGTPKPKAAVEWTKERRDAFQAAKAALRKATHLTYPKAGTEMALMVDASAAHIGAALQQRESATAAWQPLGFFSKKLDATQQRYSAYDRELLACVQGIRHFRFMLEGRPFTLYTDHKPLTFALSKAAEAWTARQSRHLSYVAEFTNDIRHISGADNIVADTLSRPPTSEVNAVAAAAAQLDYAAIAASQHSCADTRAAKEASTTLRPVRFSGVELLSDTSGPSPRPLIPAAHRRQVFDAFHSLGHPGVKATGRVIGARVTWPFMKRDIAAWVKDCQACSRAKVTRQPPAAVNPIPVPSQRFSHIHVDFVGPLTTSKEGFRYLFTIIDRTSRWLEAIPMSTMDTDTCVEALISNWIARFGKPAVITSDRGSQFTSSLWASTCQQLGVAHNTTTAYHPQSNGMVERVHRHLKEGLKARGADADWPQHLPWVLLNIRTTPKSDSNTSAAEMVYGAPLTLPAQPAAAEETPPTVADQQRAGKQIPTRPPPNGPQEEVPRHLREAELVYVRRGGQGGPLAAPYNGPYQVLERGPKFFRLNIGNQEQTVSVDRLKPHTGTAATGPAAPPRRGRPPAVRVPESPPPPPPARRTPSPGLPATTNARPARERRPPARLDL